MGILDAICVFLALITAHYLHFKQGEAFPGLREHWWLLIRPGLVFLVSFSVSGLYDPDRLLRVSGTLAATFVGVMLGCVVNTTVFDTALTPVIGSRVFFSFAVFMLAGVALNRLLFMTVALSGCMTERCLIVGTSGGARRAITLVHEHPHAGLKILGVIVSGGDHNSAGRFIGEYPVLGNLDALEKFVHRCGVDRLVLAAGPDCEPDLLRRLRRLRYRGLTLTDYVSLHEELIQEVPIDCIDDKWLFLASLNKSRIHTRRLKRWSDILVSLTGLLVSALPAALAALMIRGTSRGPILYRQERLGRDGQPFEILKFRTMREDAESQTGPVWAAEDDPRITPVGKWLRKFRIDEIPQLWCVLRGDMSLVGPRPERAVFVRRLSDELPFYSERLLVPPGITGWAQVMLPYTASIEGSRRKVQYDLYYIKHMSFLFDCLIMLKTFRTILFGRERAKSGVAPAAPALATEMDH